MTNNNDIEKRLWAAADELRANSGLSPAQYYIPVLGLIFLRYVDHRFALMEKGLGKSASSRRQIGKTDYHARGVLYVPPKSRFDNLLRLPEGSDLGAAVNDAMKAIEGENANLRDVLPGTYNKFENATLFKLFRLINSIEVGVEGDILGKVYEYFLGQFALSEGRRGGEFFTPTSIVKLIVEILEPFHGRILDPACGSGGMFVQSARFVANHHKKVADEISLYGQDKSEDTVRLCKTNLAAHGLEADIREGNTYYEDLHASRGAFDFVMANPPFNVNSVDKERLKDDPRFPFGLPRADNANYLWIELFYSALNPKGRAGFVMANSAADARISELDIRRKLIQSGTVDIVIAVSKNFFNTVTVPVTLWFLDRGKAGTGLKDKVLFLDARRIFRQIDRAHRDFAPEHLEFLANVVRLYRGREPEFENGSAAMLKERFPDGKYADVAGLCKVATVADIESQGWSLNPGRYVGITERELEKFDLRERLLELNEELDVLSQEANNFKERISNNINGLTDNDQV